MIRSLPLLLVLTFASPSLGQEPPPQTLLDRSAVEKLLKHRDAKTRWRAAESLWKLDHKPAQLVPIFTQLLLAKDPDIRAASAWRLGRMGSSARHAVPTLAASLRDEDREVRLQVGLALANLGAFSEPALPALVRALGDAELDVDQGSPLFHVPAPGVRASPALPALVELTEEAIPLLIPPVRDKDDASPDHAISPLLPPPPLPPSHRPTLVETDDSDTSLPLPPLGEPDDRTVSLSEAETRAAGAFPAFGARGIPPLVELLASSDEHRRLFAVVALGEIARVHGLPKTHITKMEKLLSDRSLPIRYQVARTMALVRPASLEAVAVLPEALKASLADDSTLLSDLERMAPHNPAARKMVLAMRTHEDKAVVEHAHEILARLTLPTEQALAVWTKALSHPEEDIRRIAIAELKQLGPKAKSAKMLLRARFPKEGDIAKLEILASLTAIDPDDPALLPMLLRSLDHQDAFDRMEVLNCLASLGPKAKAALPTIGTLIEKYDESDRDWVFGPYRYARQLVATVLGINSDRKTVTSLLLKGLRNPRFRAANAARIGWFMRDDLEDGLLRHLPDDVAPIRELLKDDNAEIRHSAALVLLRAGREIETALPVLMDGLSSEPPHYQQRVFEVLGGRPHPRSAALAEVWVAAWSTAKGDSRTHLESGLLALQPEAVPLLLEQLRKAPTAKAKSRLAHLLAQFEGQAKHVVPILREDLRSKIEANRVAAAVSLQRLGPDAKAVVPDLVRWLDDADPGMRGLAAETLAGIGPAARPAVPALKTMLNDKAELLRLLAANALSRIDPTQEEALAPLLARFTVDSSREFELYLEGILLGLPDPDELGHILSAGSEEDSILRFGEPAVKALAKILDDTNLDEWNPNSPSAQGGSKARIRAALLLAKVGPDAKSAVPALEQALDDFDPFVREAAASALGRIGPAAKAAIPHMIGQLERDNLRISSAQPWATSSSNTTGGRRPTSELDYDIPFDFRTFGRRPGRGSGYVFVYSDSPIDRYSDVRPEHPFDPIYVLSRIDTESRMSLPILKQMAKDAGHPRRLAAALAVRQLDGDDTHLVPALTTLLEAHTKLAPWDAPPLTREMRECLSELGPALKPTVPVLVRWLRRHRAGSHPDDQVRVIAALGSLGSHASPAIGLLQPARGERAESRIAAALALYEITGEPDRTFSILRDILTAHVFRGTMHSRDAIDSARSDAVRALGVLAKAGDKRARTLVEETAKSDGSKLVRDTARKALKRSTRE